jgi:hypothetical protein
LPDPEDTSGLTLVGSRRARSPVRGSVAGLGRWSGVELLTAALAFAGAGLGSGIAYRATLGATRVEREARRREEWGRRFTAALTAVTASEPRQVATGHALLLQLIRSDLATEEDRNEARAVLEVLAIRGEGPGADLRLLPQEDLEVADIVEDTGGDQPAEGDAR